MLCSAEEDEHTLELKKWKQYQKEANEMLGSMTSELEVGFGVADAARTQSANKPWMQSSTDAMDKVNVELQAQFMSLMQAKSKSTSYEKTTAEALEKAVGDARIHLELYRDDDGIKSSLSRQLNLVENKKRKLS